eukprot:jgi/Astpho2/455/Aster-x0928
MSDDEWNPSAELAEEGASPSNIGPLSLDAEGSFRYEPHSPGGIQLRLKAMPEQGLAYQALLNTNISQNKPLIEAASGSAQAAVLSWGLTAPANLPDGFRQPDIIIAADVVYHREIFEPLLSTLTAFGDNTVSHSLAADLGGRNC